MIPVPNVVESNLIYHFGTRTVCNLSRLTSGDPCYSFEAQSIALQICDPIVAFVAEERSIGCATIARTIGECHIQEGVKIRGRL